MLKLSLAMLAIILSICVEGAEQQNLNKIANDFEKTKKNLLSDDEKQRKIMSSLFMINKKMKKIVIDQSSLEQEKAMLENSAKNLANRILELDLKVKNQKTLMRERLVAIYKLGGQGLARIIFSSINSAQLESNLKILGIIANRDLQLVKEISENISELQTKKNKFLKRLTKLKKVEERIKEKELNLAKENDTKSKILDKIRSSKKFSLLKLDEIRRKVSQVQENDDSGILDLLFRPSFYERKGKIDYPVNGIVTQKYGIVKDEKFNISWPHKGVFFNSKEYEPVKSVFDGKVTYVGQVPGFGKTLIIDHGDHYYTVYSYLKNILVNAGDEIKSKQQIAAVGRNDEENMQGIYFEIRHFSEPYDPLTWLKGSAL